METVDVVVVGAGHNGLVGANLLADAGWSVLVLEATAGPGGSVRSADITAPGFRSDLCSAFYPLGYVSPALRRLDLEQYGLRWRHAPSVLAHVVPGGRAAVIERDPERTAEGLEHFAPGDGQRWLDVCRQWRELAPTLLPVLLGPFPPLRAGLDLLRKVSLADVLRLARRMLVPARQLGSELFRGEGAQLLLAGCAAHTDLGPDDASGGVYGWLMAMLAQQHGFPVVAGGAQGLTDALVRRLAVRGGEVRCAAPVARVVVRAGRAVGVVTVDGRPVRARRAILADVPATTLYRELVGPAHLPGRLLTDLDGFTWDNATVKVDWALSAPVPWTDPTIGPAGTVHIGADLNGLARYGADLASGQAPEQPFVLAGQMTTADPTRSPAGTEAMWAYSHLPGRRTWSPDEVRRQADRIQAVLEHAAPGFGSRVLARAVTGPAELADENPSLIGGAITGGTASPFQQLFFRPIPGLGRADTVIDRLYLASSSAHPGGGVHGVPGANAARAALARARLATGPLYHSAIGRAHRAIYQ